MKFFFRFTLDCFTFHCDVSSLGIIGELIQDLLLICFFSEPKVLMFCEPSCLLL